MEQAFITLSGLSNPEIIYKEIYIEPEVVENPLSLEIQQNEEQLLPV